MSNELGQEPAFPVDYRVSADSHRNGMSKRFYAACAAKDDFDDLNLYLQEKIVGEKVPRCSTKHHSYNPNIDVESMEYAVWLAKGRSKWKYMQADELLKQEINEQK